MQSSQFVTIWTQPRSTIRSIVAQNPALHVAVLVSLAGIDEALDRASMRNAGDRMPLPAILLAALLIGPAAGHFTLWSFSHLLRWTGTWLGGVATREHLRSAMAWAAVPIVASLPLWIPQLFVFGPDLFTKDGPHLEGHLLLALVALGFDLLELALAIWALVLLSKCVAEVQGFRSAWRGLWNAVLAAAVVVVPILGLVLLLLLASGLKG